MTVRPVHVIRCSKGWDDRVLVVGTQRFSYLIARPWSASLPRFSTQHCPNHFLPQDKSLLFPPLLFVTRSVPWPETFPFPFPFFMSFNCTDFSFFEYWTGLPSQEPLLSASVDEPFSTLMHCAASPPTGFRFYVSHRTVAKVLLVVEFGPY